MVRCIRIRKLAVGFSPLALRRRSKRATILSTEACGKDPCPLLGLINSAQRMAAARPNTTMSSNELEPKRFAPCTDTQAASPMAIKPGMMVSGLPSLRITTSP